MGNEPMTLEKIGAGIEKINERLDGMDKRFDGIDQRFDCTENRFEKQFDRLFNSVGSIEYDLKEVKGELKDMNRRYDTTFSHLSDFLGRLSDQESESTFLKNDQDIIKSALRLKIGLDADAPEFR
jgi:flagellar capping protein FliD